MPKLITQLNETTKRVPRVVDQIGKELADAVAASKDEADAKSRIRGLIDKFYGAEKWSTEKEEWDKLSDPEKGAVVSAVYKHVRNREL